MYRLLTPTIQGPAIQSNVHSIVCYDHEPSSQPDRVGGLVSGGLVGAPRVSIRSWYQLILEPRDMPSKPPVINHEVCATYERKSFRAPRDREKARCVRKNVSESSELVRRFLLGHPVALDKVISYHVVDVAVGHLEATLTPAPIAWVFFLCPKTKEKMNMTTTHGQ